MNDFSFFFSLGWHHIISWDAADHILFIIALSAIYFFKNWKQVLILVTAFTIGHSLTLALSVYDILRVNSHWVEFLIPVTIMATAVFNFVQKNFTPSSLKLNYFLALFFGLIHGLGFANSIRFMLAKNEHIGLPLFAFNIGLEAGQIVIVFLILSCSFILVNKLKLQRKWWVWILSAAAFSCATFMAIKRWPL
ncbi:MAG: HupE/UreJ family protein [Ferruginibacter sp.]